MKDIQITCDSCGADLTMTGNCVDYRLVLRSEELPHESSTVTCMMIYPDLDRDYHFCGKSCLKNWILK